MGEGSHLEEVGLPDAEGVPGQDGTQRVHVYFSKT